VQKFEADIYFNETSPKELYKYYHILISLVETHKLIIEFMEVYHSLSLIRAHYAHRTYRNESSSKVVELNQKFV
jgi:hypothetical protein